MRAFLCASRCRQMSASKTAPSPNKKHSASIKLIRGNGNQARRRLVFSSARRYYSCQSGVHSVLYHDCNSTHTCRLRYELRRFSRILSDQLGFARRPRSYWYHWHNFQWRHVGDVSEKNTSYPTLSEGPLRQVYSPQTKQILIS